MFRGRTYKLIACVCAFSLCLIGLEPAFQAYAYDEAEIVEGSTVEIESDEESVYALAEATDTLTVPSEDSVASESESELESEYEDSEEDAASEESEIVDDETAADDEGTTLESEEAVDEEAAVEEAAPEEEEAQAAIDETPVLRAAPAKAPARAPTSNARMPEEGYTLEYLANRGYSLVCFENATIDQHTMGGLLIGGDMTQTTSAPGIADSQYVAAPSYIEGYARPIDTGVFNARSRQNPVQPLYVSSRNTVSPDGKMLNGVGNSVSGEGYNYHGQVVVNDGYVDWAKMEKAATSLSRQLKDVSSVTLNEFQDWSEVPIDAGTSVTFENTGAKHVKVNVKGSSKKFTVINILDSGTVYAPQVISYNGRQLSTAEDGEDMPIILNFPNATKVVIGDQTPEQGHIIAPNAYVEINGGNYNGTIICKSAKLSGQGHVRRFHGDYPGPALQPVWISKADSQETPLAGATLEIVDKNGEVVDSFVTTDEPYGLKVLPGTYTLREKDVPAGYQKAEDIAFEVSDKGVITVDGVQVADKTVTMTDEFNPVTANLQAHKTLKGGQLKGDDFQFVLKDQAGEEVETVKNDAQGFVQFSPMTFDEPGTWTYTISEVDGSFTDAADCGGMAYDANVYTAVVDVAKGENGLEANVTYKDASGNPVAVGDANSDGAPVFVNVQVQSLELHKVDGTDRPFPSDLNALVAFDVSYTSPEGATEVVQSGIHPDAQGIVKFSNLKPGTYTITETDAPDSYIKLEEPIVVTVTSEGAIELTSAQENVVSLVDAVNADSTAQAAPGKVLMVRNYPYIVMPETGLSNRLVFQTLGAIAMLVGACLYATTRRRARGSSPKGGCDGI
ncbi:Predicted outer membrane protein [Slackia heliotrinireducens]|uniref:Putative collagen-binding protein n=1 Tax=Slackia heliotrinireducens (strain ATCC 29202 / DSM 20476 / NCTC 11029 / RHS 1) TaxID=471855 RepID=C7N201_SLAHD|nr:SpaA isopeptide-forming pilin-related protein [Slackia heliotrinireducens]ACV23442.1 putative collagen-binding protein [Slackia heliotrinireducens DSM 20476]VEH02752.1 Predicted outer membrane protein [Slackia heliotrinireducens]